MQAVYNYTFVTRDPGAAYHNPRYTLQIIHDTLDSLAQSGKVTVNMQGKVGLSARPGKAWPARDAGGEPVLRLWKKVLQTRG
jgi:hypothetical protein